jgi:hypothetical protein
VAWEKEPSSAQSATSQSMEHLHSFTLFGFAISNIAPTYHYLLAMSTTYTLA